MKIWLDLLGAPGIQCWILFDDDYALSFDEKWQVRYYEESTPDDEDFSHAGFTLIYDSHE